MAMRVPATPSRWIIALGRGITMVAGTVMKSNPRTLLTKWGNDGDEWVRYIVRLVLSSGRALTPGDVEHAYNLFRQEKSLDARTLAQEPELAATTITDEAEEPLAITCLHDVTGVNALAPGAVIEPHAGLTILFGREWHRQDRIRANLQGSRGQQDSRCHSRRH